MISVLSATALWMAASLAAPEAEEPPAYTVQWAAH